MARMLRPVRSDLRVRRASLPRIFAPGGVAEIAHFLGVSTSQVSTWIERRSQNGCPWPLWESRMGATYDLLEWQRWRKGERFENNDHANVAISEADIA